VRTSARSDDKKYAIDMYGYDSDRKYSFCQSCRQLTHRNYIEVNEIELKPEYEWSQMNLCLCLKCSKDFEKLRGNERSHAAFIQRLRTADLSQEEPICVPIEGKEIYFTATHLGEIQEILRLQTPDSKK
jgi:hypothetical protein